MRLYVCGPISSPDPAQVERNLAAFHAAADTLRDAGYLACNPAAENGLPRTASWGQHMRADIPLLLRCNGLALLPGWQGSKGARLEVHIATELGMPCGALELWLGVAGPAVAGGRAVAS